MAGKSAAGAASKAEMIESLFDHSSDLMHVVGPGGLMKLINPAWATLLGWAPKDVVGRPAIEFNHADDQPGVVEGFRDLPTGGVVERQVRMRAKDGSFH